MAGWHGHHLSAKEVTATSSSTSTSASTASNAKCRVEAAMSLTRRLSPTRTATSTASSTSAISTRCRRANNCAAISTSGVMDRESATGGGDQPPQHQEQEDEIDDEAEEERQEIVVPMDESADEVEVDEPFPSLEELSDEALEEPNSEPCEQVLDECLNSNTADADVEPKAAVTNEADDPPAAKSSTTTDIEAAEIKPEMAQVEAPEKVEVPSSKPLPPNGTARRKRKRSRKWVYSTSRAKSSYSKYKRQLSSLGSTDSESAPVSTLQASRGSHGVLVNGRAGDDSLSSIVPQTQNQDTSEEPWDWQECEVYFNRIIPQDVHALEKIRTSCANVVASNQEHGCSRWNRALRARILEEATDAALYRVHPTRRGRYYHDVWEEEDFLEDQRRAKQYSGKTLLFEDQNVVLSNSELVFGYNDDLFVDYIMKLESRVYELRHQAALKSEKEERYKDNHKISGKRKRAIEDFAVVLKDTILPSIPSDLIHPAAMGHFIKKKSKKAQQKLSWDHVHPASVCSSFSRERWEQELECYAEHMRQQRQNNDDSDEEKEFEMTTPGTTLVVAEEELKQFGPYGSVLENDEISEAINTSVSHLVSLSMLNWRRSQVLYERVQCGEHCARVEQQEHEARDNLENLYRQLFPKSKSTKSTTAEDDDAQEQEPRDQQLQSRPRDIISYCTRNCVNAPQARAVAASVEYAMSLRVGDQIDILDRDGRWNGAMVEDVFTEGERVVKYVSVRYSQWRDSTAEWIGVSEGRVVPHGVATAKYVCCLAPTKTRSYRVEFNRLLVQELDLFFQMNRISRRLQSNLPPKPAVENAKVKPAKKRRRTSAAHQ